MATNTETIIMAYKQANEDISEILAYVDSISNPSQLNESGLPTLVKYLENKDSAVAVKYISCAALVGGPLAMAIGSSIATGILTSGMAAGGAMLASGALLGGGALAFGGMGLSMIPGLNLLALPLLAAPSVIKLLKDAKIKRYVKENQATMKQKKARIQKSKEKLTRWFADLQNSAAEIDQKIHETLNQEFAEYKEKTKKLAKNVAIQIDDCLNANTNKRIMQYNEVILNQYRLQQDLEGRVDFLFTEYQKLLSQKQELERQMKCLLKLLNAMNCPESVINQALHEEA